VVVLVEVVVVEALFGQDSLEISLVVPTTDIFFVGGNEIEICEGRSGRRRGRRSTSWGRRRARARSTLLKGLVVLIEGGVESSRRWGGGRMVLRTRRGGEVGCGTRRERRVKGRGRERGKEGRKGGQLGGSFSKGGEGLARSKRVKIFTPSPPPD